MDLHPFFTHFPIVLLTIVVLIEIVKISFSARVVDDVVIGWFLWGASIATAASFYTGYNASEMANQTFIVSNDVISQHHTWGRFLLFAVPITAVMQLASYRAKFNQNVFKWLFYLSLVISLLLAVVTGYHGGELVFRHGAGVSAILSVH